MPNPFLRRLVVCLLVFVSALASPLAANAQVPGLNLGGVAEEASSEGEQALQNLIEVLRDDAARAALIAELERVTDPDAPAAAEEESSLLSLELRSVGGQVADFTQRMAEGTASGLANLWIQIAAAPQIFSALSMGDLAVVWSIVVDLLSLILITYGGFFAMKALTDGFRTTMRSATATEGVIARTISIVTTFSVDVISAIVPWAVGYVVALSILGTPGDISFAHSLYLNAFVMIEVVMALARVVFSPKITVARLVRLKDAHARQVMAWLRVFASLFVFGQFLVLPLFSRMVSPAAGRALSVLGLLIMLGLMAFVVMRMHRAVSLLAIRRFRNVRANKGFRVLVRYWHVPVLIYIGALAIVAITRPIADFYVILIANLQVALAILAGVIVANIITRMIGGGVHLPSGIAMRVPLLERQLNSFVPRILYVLRLAVVATVVIFCLHTLGAIDFFAVLESQLGARLAGTIVTVSIILLVSFAIWLVLNSWVDYRINPEYALAVSARERTLLVLMRNALTITLIVVSLMFILSELGINIAPLLASAGVIGLAIGFGAQKLVQDIITGIFIQLEGAIDVGDVVSIGGISGVVERLTIRSASLRDVEGSYHIIPFSSVDTVTNFMRGFSYALLDMGVAYRENTEEAKQAMFDAFEELRKDPDHRPNIIADLEWLGLNAFGPSEIVLRARIKTLPGKQWGTKRAYNAIIKRIFDERGIEIPFPHQTVYFGEDKQGKAPPLHVVSEPNKTTKIEPGTKETDGQENSKPRRRRKKSADGSPDLPDVDAGPDR